jgi:hypothetical protein
MLPVLIDFIGIRGQDYDREVIETRDYGGLMLEL